MKKWQRNQCSKRCVSLIYCQCLGAVYFVAVCAGLVIVISFCILSNLLQIICNRFGNIQKLITNAGLLSLDSLVMFIFLMVMLSIKAKVSDW